jgi:hypothetical protein
MYVYMYICMYVSLQIYMYICVILYIYYVLIYVHFCICKCIDWVIEAANNIAAGTYVCMIDDMTVIYKFM